MPAIEEREKVTRYVSDARAHGAESTPPEPSLHRVLIAGAGPAGVEAALSLERIAGGRVLTTIVAPEERFVRLPRPCSRPSPRPTVGAPA